MVGFEQINVANLFGLAAVRGVNDRLQNQAAAQLILSMRRFSIIGIKTRRTLSTGWKVQRQAWWLYQTLVFDLSWAACVLARSTAWHRRSQVFKMNSTTLCFAVLRSIPCSQTDLTNCSGPGTVRPNSSSNRPQPRVSTGTSRYAWKAHSRAVSGKRSSKDRSMVLRGVRSLSVHDSFGTKGWTVSVHDDFDTYEINFGICVFL